jgi:hypothetical protein
MEVEPIVIPNIPFGELVNKNYNSCDVPDLFKEAGLPFTKCKYRLGEKAIAYIFPHIDHARFLFYSDLNETLSHINIVDHQEQTILIFHGNKLHQMVDIIKKCVYTCKGDTLQCGAFTLCEPQLKYENKIFHLDWKTVTWKGTYFGLEILAAAANIRNVFEPFQLKAFGKFSLADNIPSIYYDLGIDRLECVSYLNIRMIVPLTIANRGTHPHILMMEREPISNALIPSFRNELFHTSTYPSMPFNPKFLAHLGSVSTYVHMANVCEEIISKLPPRPCTIFLINTPWYQAEKKVLDKNTVWIHYRAALEAWRCGRLHFLNLVPLRIIK